MPVNKSSFNVKLHIEKQGQGQPFILLHGWGFNYAVWQSIVPELAQQYCVYQVDLPGHGKSEMCDYDLPVLLNVLADQLPKHAIWLGWSLGGLLAMAMARWQPDYVDKLIVVAGSPCFVAKSDWQHATQLNILNQFIEQLQKDVVGTLKRFLALQTRGSDTAQQQLRQLRQLLTVNHLPHHDALQAGLHLLLHTDLRPELTHIQCPSLLILGEKDRLVPAKMEQDCQQYWQNLNVAVIPQAAHIPFLSHPVAFLKVVQCFI